MPREEDRRSGKFVGPDGCGEEARGDAQRSAAPPRPCQDSRQIQGRFGGDPVPKGRMAQHRHRCTSVSARPERSPGSCQSTRKQGGTISPHRRWPADRHLRRGRRCALERFRRVTAVMATVRPLHSGRLARDRAQQVESNPALRPWRARFSSFQGFGAPVPLSRCATPLVPAVRPLA